MIDVVTIVVKGGCGGDGAVSFATTRYKPKGPPDGGDGGNGGNVIAQTTRDVHTLLDFHFKSAFLGQDGKRGGRSHRRGEQGTNLVLRVPIGTVVQGLGELLKEGQELVLAVGGRGGRGNAHTKISALPKSESREQRYAQYQQAESGEPGEERQLVLELKLIADVGLVGLPNAGKSTLLSVLTAARPKIADYPFTTLEPNLGVMRVGDSSLTLADIPGLIEGAAHGKGLGHDFLRHIERTRVLVHLISAELDDVVVGYKTVRDEMHAYAEKLLQKQELVVLNKVDILDSAGVHQRLEALKSITTQPLAISAVTGEGIEELKRQLARRTQE